jgi:hypothetical protein
MADHSHKLAPGWNLVEQYLISPLCDTCGDRYTGEHSPLYYPDLATALAEMRSDRWHVSPERHQCLNCVDDQKPHYGPPDSEEERWHHLHGWSVRCQGCSTSTVEDWDPEGEVTRPVWPTPAKAAQDLHRLEGWTCTDRTRCPKCTTAHLGNHVEE